MLMLSPDVTLIASLKVAYFEARIPYPYLDNIRAMPLKPAPSFCSDLSMFLIAATRLQRKR
jgi:hypothetical protein